MNPDWFLLAMSLAGGLALFLFGLDQLSDGLKQAAGDTLKTLLTRLTSNRFLAALTGALVTGILNSSSVTTVLVVGFVTAGVMTLAQSVAVIMGANVGSTVTAQILAFNLSAYALLPIAIGFFLMFASRRDSVRSSGKMLMGLGLVFYGMGVMSDGMKPLRSYAPFVNALASMARPLYGIVAGAIFTGLVQSSAATVGIAIAMASDGLLSLPAGIALALGANLGTCATALLAALGKPVEAVRAATVHMLFNALGVLLWLPFINVLAAVAVAVSSAAPDLEGQARLAAEVPRQIANANSIFNILNTIFFIGFTGWFARLSTMLVRSRPKGAEDASSKFVDAAALSVPAVALEQVRQEIGRLGDTLQSMLIELPQKPDDVSTRTLDEVAGRRNQIQALEGTILAFLSRIRLGTLTGAESQTHIALTMAALNLRQAADIIVDDLVAVGRAAAAWPDHAGALQQPVVSELYQSVQRAVALTVRAVRREDGQAARDVIAMSDPVRRLAEELLARLAARSRTGDAEALDKLRLQTGFVDGLRHVFTLMRRVARTVESPGELDEASAHELPS